MPERRASDPSPIDTRQAARASQALLVLVVYAVFAMVQHLEVVMGLIGDARQSWLLTTWNLAGGIGFYAGIRSGLNLRLRRGRSLGIPQALWAMVGITWSYTITGPARGAVILIMALVVIFGMFELTPRRARTVAIAAFVLLASAMTYKAVTDPLRYDPRVEAIHLVFSGIVLAAAYVLTIRIAGLRIRLQQQRTELAQALERIQALATQDELTGLTNRRAAMERMRDELAVRGRPEPGMGLALIDIDHFKQINDRYGHAAGDLVLRRFAASAQAVLRQGDVLARWGGEEFLLVMPATALDAAASTVERARRVMADLDLTDIAPDLHVTFSAGVSRCTDRADLEAAVARADAAMYAAKRDGRNRSRLSAALSSGSSSPNEAEAATVG